MEIKEEMETMEKERSNTGAEIETEIKEEMEESKRGETGTMETDESNIGIEMKDDMKTMKKEDSKRGTEGETNIKERGGEGDASTERKNIGNRVSDTENEEKKETSRYRSPWLESTLGELDTRTKTMLKLVEEDADSFVQRAEMYYKKRPELVGFIEDFYRTQRSLAEGYDNMYYRENVARKAIIEWMFLLTNIFLEISVVAIEQISSPSKPHFALIAMVLSFAAMIVCTGELFYKGLKERLILKRHGKRSSSWRKNLSFFYDYIDAFSLICAVSQFFFSIVAYSYHHRHADNPIKVSVVSLIFILCLAFSGFLKKRNHELESPFLPLKKGNSL